MWIYGQAAEFVGRHQLKGKAAAHPQHATSVSAQPLSRKEKRTLAKKEKAAEARAKHSWPHQRAQNKCRVPHSEKPRSPEAACRSSAPCFAIPPPASLPLSPFFPFVHLVHRSEPPRVASCLGAIPERHRRRRSRPVPDLLPPCPGTKRSQLGTSRNESKPTRQRCNETNPRLLLSAERWATGPSARGGTLFVSRARRIY